MTMVMSAFEEANGFSSLSADELFFVNGGSGSTGGFSFTSYGQGCVSVAEAAGAAAGVCAAFGGPAGVAFAGVVGVCAGVIYGIEQVSISIGAVTGN